MGRNQGILGKWHIARTALSIVVDPASGIDGDSWMVDLVQLGHCYMRNSWQRTVRRRISV